MCENLHYEWVYFKQLHKDQVNSIHRQSTERGAAVVPTITSFKKSQHSVTITFSSYLISRLLYSSRCEG